MNKGRTEQFVKILESGEKTLPELSEITGLSRDNIYFYIRKLIDSGKAIRAGLKFNDSTGRMNEVYKLISEGEQITDNAVRPKITSLKAVIVHLSDEDYNYLLSRDKSTKSNNFRAIINDSRRYRTRHQI